jgi:hypothetical protein
VWNRFQDVEHLFRVAGLFAVGVVIFVVARAAFVPDDFGVYGHYRAGALDDARSRPIVFAGRAACAECHEDAGTAAGAHARVGCEACHGAQAAHAADPGAATPGKLEPATLCLNCHRASASKPEWFAQIDPADHAAGESCDACHAPHAPALD